MKKLYVLLFLLVPLFASSQVPVNDLCDNAIELACDGDFVSGSTTSATNDLVTQGITSCGTSITSSGIWYEWAGVGPVTATTCGDFYDYDTKISVFTGSCDDLDCVAGNDDDCDDGVDPFLSTVTWTAQEGQHYFIYVHGFSSGVGDFELSLEVGDPAPPWVVINADDVGEATNQPFEITIDFSHSVSDFSQEDIEVTNGTVTSFTGSGGDYQAEITPTEEGDVTVVIPESVATSDCGENSESNTIETFYDTTPPEVNGMNITRSLDESGNVEISPEELDDSENPSNDGDGSGIDGELTDISQSEFDCGDLGDNEVTVTLVDYAGNSAMGTVTVTIQDNMGPEFIEFSEKDAYLDEDGEFTFDTDWLLGAGEEIRAAISEGGTVEDNCTDPEDITFEFSPSMVDCSQLYYLIEESISVLVTATDLEGNSTDHEIDVYVRDNVSPKVVVPDKRIILVSNQDAIVTVTADGNDGTRALINKGKTFDNCEIVSWSIEVGSLEDARLGMVSSEGSPSAELGVGEYSVWVRGYDRSENSDEDEGILEIKVGDLQDFLNKPPELTVEDQITAKNTPLIIPIEFSDPDDDEVEVVEVTSSNPDLISEENIYFEERDGQLVLIIKPTAFGTGEATVSITITDGTEEVVITFTVIVSEVTGIEDLIAQAIRIYPNPTHGLVQIEISNVVSLLGENPTLKYLDLTGRLLGEVPLYLSRKDFFGEIDLKAQPQGIYFLRITGNEHTVIKRIQKQ